MIRTAKQILADIAASGGDVGEEGDDDVPPGPKAAQIRGGRSSSKQLKPPVAVAAVAVSRTGVVDTVKPWVRRCRATGCHNESPEHPYCSGHRYRLRKYGNLQLDRPLACRCGHCPYTVSQRRRKLKIEQVGDVWLAVVV